MNSRAGRFFVGLATFGAACVLAAPSPVAAQALEPTVRVDRNGTAAGEVLNVVGQGWNSNGLILVELCGQEGRAGSVDCDVVNGQLVSTLTDGRFFAALPVGRPPQPCPCVVHAADQNSDAAAIAPIALQGLPTVPVAGDVTSPAEERAITVTDVHLEGSSSFREWFGGRAERTLVFTVRNSGKVALHHPPVAITVGKGDDPTGIVSPPDVGTVAPGESRTVHVKVHTDPFVFGRQTVRVEMQGFATPVVGRASTKTYPWGLAVLGYIVLVNVVLLSALRRLTRREVRKQQELLDLTEVDELSAEREKESVLT